MTHICVSKLTIIVSDNGLSPGRHQAIIWTDAEISLTWPFGTNFSERVIEIQQFPLKTMHLKMSSTEWPPFCLRLNVLSTTKSHQISSLILENVVWSTKANSNSQIANGASRNLNIHFVGIIPVPGLAHLSRDHRCTVCSFMYKW